MASYLFGPGGGADEPTATSAAPADACAPVGPAPEDDDTWWRGLYDLLACFPANQRDEGVAGAADTFERVDAREAGAADAALDEAYDDELRDELERVASGALSVK